MNIQSRQYVSCPAGGKPVATPESTPRLPADRSERSVKNDPPALADPKGTSGKYLSENPLVVSGIAMTHENAWTAYNDTPASSEQSAASLNGRGEIPVTLYYQQRLFG